MELGGADQNALLPLHAVPHLVVGGELVEPNLGNFIHGFDTKHDGFPLSQPLTWSKARMKSASFSTPSVGMAL